MFGLLNKAQLYAFALASFALSVLGIYFMGAARGKARLQEKIAAKRQEEFAKGVEIEREIQQMDDTSLADRASEWVQSDDKSK